MVQCAEEDNADPVTLVSRVQTRRQRVADAARALFAERGFHSTGMAQISSLAGIKMGQIYRDFSGKDAIVAAIVEADLDHFLREGELAQAIAAGDPVAIRDWLTACVGKEGDVQQRRLLPEIIAEASRNDSIAELLQDCDARIRRSLELALAALAPGVAKAGVRSDLAQLITTLMVGLPQRLVALPGLDATRLGASFQAVIDREIDGLMGKG